MEICSICIRTLDTLALSWIDPSVAQYIFNYPGYHYPGPAVVHLAR